MKAYGTELENGGQAEVDADVIPQTKGQSYYVDSENGDDKKAGTSQQEAWKTIEKVNSVTFQPGDKILLKAGSVWENVTLSPKGSGSEEEPIVLSAYGEGALPKLKGNAQVGETLYLENQEYWDISNLEISNQAEGFTGSEGNLLKDVRGIRIAAKAGAEKRTLSGYRIHNLYVHDVTGLCCWISGNESDSGNGIVKAAGWDGSKRTGAIVFEVLAPDNGALPVTFDDILIEKNVLNNNSFGGIIIKQWKGDKRGTNEYWANRETGNNWTPHTNVTIQDNYLSHAASDYACNTIYLTSTKGALIQRNVSKAAGTCGIEMYYTDDTVVQYNEVYETRAKAGGADSNAIDPDKWATNALIQYNYIHDTGDGILLCGFIEGSSVVRYNVIQDAEKRYLNPHGDKGYNYIYNNIFYNTEGDAKFVSSSGGDRYYNDSNNFYYFSNNIFYNAAASGTVEICEGTSLLFDNNCYYGGNIKTPGNDLSPIEKDPLFVNADISGAKTEVSILENLKLQEASPLLGMGVLVDWGDKLDVTAGDTDFFGNDLQTPASVGIAEYTGEAGIAKGYVTNEFGSRVSGAEIKVAGKSAATTDETGYYQITNLEEGSYDLTVSKDQYEDGTAKLQVEKGKITVQNLKMGTCYATTGVITGTVTYSGKPYAGATVTVTDGTNGQETVSDENGVYTFELPAGKGYSVSVNIDGFEEICVQDIEVKVLSTVTADLPLSKKLETPVYFINEDFSAYEQGAFNGGGIWGITDPGTKNGTLTIEEENGNAYLYLNKSATSNLAVYNTAPLGAKGIVTVEARVKRMSDGSAANQYGLYTFNSKDWNLSSPADSKNPMATFALSKGSILTHNQTGSSATATASRYELGQWYIVRNVANLDTGTFDLYVNDMETPVLKNQPLRTVRDSIDYVNLFSSKTNLGDICVDYIRVCNGDAYDYEDTEINNVKMGDMILAREGNRFRTTVSAETEKVSLLPELSSGFADASINGEIWDKTTPYELTLAPGENLITITVTAESKATETYEVLIVREDPQALAYLKNLTVEGVNLLPEFDPYTTEYAGETDLKVISLSYEKATELCTEKLSVNGTEISDIKNIALQKGENVVAIEVGSQDGTNYLTYTITLNCTAEEPEEKPEEKPADTAALKHWLEKAKAEVIKTDLYTAESLEALQQAIWQAEEILNTSDVQQAEVDECAEALQNAMKNLKPAEQQPGDGDSGNNGGSGDDGNGSGSGDDGNGSGSGNDGNGSGSGDDGNGSGSGDDGNGSGSGNDGNGSGSGDDGNGSGSGNDGNGSGSGNSGNGSGALKTGDETNVVIPLFLGSMAVVVIAAGLYRKRERKK